MTSLRKIKKDVEAIKQRTNPEKVCYAWLESDGFVYPHRNDFDSPNPGLRMTPEEYAAKMKGEGYTKVVLVTWSFSK